ncbi:hypothetical protein PPERSA_05831 [Pseudocohnilembus persalinus]|uniref:Uncharacterized protein n=1 Tax=Pseudocohnilembus persalinus TaxID=266149 RepID=A0A0V0QG89_PSEPJ|nr:hypothetical protein PPERSA_05831 [Pseudocohnilembus persalinus]|eukprot:KRX01245.1 hypothetical protein PPERSA_05831 [Pseudocohnilembus persalinus]
MQRPKTAHAKQKINNGSSIKQQIQKRVTHQEFYNPYEYENQFGNMQAVLQKTSLKNIYKQNMKNTYKNVVTKYMTAKQVSRTNQKKNIVQNLQLKDYNQKNKPNSKYFSQLEMLKEIYERQQEKKGGKQLGYEQYQILFNNQQQMQKLQNQLQIQQELEQNQQQQNLLENLNIQNKNQGQQKFMSQSQNFLDKNLQFLEQNNLNNVNIDLQNLQQTPISNRNQQILSSKTGDSKIKNNILNNSKIKVQAPQDSIDLGKNNFTLQQNNDQNKNKPESFLSLSSDNMDNSLKRQLDIQKVTSQNKSENIPVIQKYDQMLVNEKLSHQQDQIKGQVNKQYQQENIKLKNNYMSPLVFKNNYNNSSNNQQKKNYNNSSNNLIQDFVAEDTQNKKDNKFDFEKEQQENFDDYEEDDENEQQYIYKTKFKPLSIIKNAAYYKIFEKQHLGKIQQEHDEIDSEIQFRSSQHLLNQTGNNKNMQKYQQQKQSSRPNTALLRSESNKLAFKLGYEGNQQDKSEMEKKYRQLQLQQLFPFKKNMYQQEGYELDLQKKKNQEKLFEKQKNRFCPQKPKVN